jgi:NitT/TauT family transport system substrate-binding protein
MLRWILAIALACTATSSCAQPAKQTSTHTPIGVIAFPSTATAALYVGAAQGFYAKAGLDVRLTATPNSRELVNGMVDGEYQFAAALIDNFVAYRANQHAVPYDPQRDLRVVMGLADASVALVARADIETIGALRQRRVGIDAPGTGFAFVLYHMLSQQGLDRGDVVLMQSGSTKARLTALERGEIDATMLTPEFALQAKAKGFRILRDSAQALPAYMGFALAVDSGWAARNSSSVRDFLRATLAAREWLERPENRPIAAEILSRELGATPQQMLELLEQLLASGALIADGRISDAGLATVLSLRRQFGNSATMPQDAAEYLDLSYLPRRRPAAPADR